MKKYLRKLAVTLLSILTLTLTAAVVIADCNVISLRKGAWQGSMQYSARCYTLYNLQSFAGEQLYRFVKSHPEYDLPNPADHPDEIFIMYCETPSYEDNLICPMALQLTPQQADIVNTHSGIDPRVRFLPGREGDSDER